MGIEKGGKGVSIRWDREVAGVDREVAGVDREVAGVRGVYNFMRQTPPV
jgi:hypothetical protein